MMTLIVGGSASGKSAFAEEQVMQTASRPRIYIATMEPFDEECRRRIARHREMRAKKEFETIECYTRLAEVRVPSGACVLLECMSNLLANEMYSPSGSGDAAKEEILRGVDALRAQCESLFIVSNEVFSGGTDYAGDTLRYLEQLGALNCALAARADRVYEVVCGVPVCYKGEERRI